MSSNRYALLGLVYLAVVSLLISTSVLAYRKDLPWQGSVQVTLVTAHPGLELNPQSDVKIQGRTVGVVRRIESTGRAATIHLSIAPDEVRWIPRNVDAAIIPKTLFGEKFVDLLPPADAATARISDGDRIRQSRTAVELGTVYAKLVPLLRSIDPAQLSTVLNTLASSLDGKGEQLGHVITQTNDFLGTLNPALPVLATDLQQLARTLAIYDDAAPDLLRTLANTSKISTDLLVPSEARLKKLLATVIATADTTRGVLARNEDDLVSITEGGRPVLEMLDRYSSNISCSLRGLAAVDRLGNQNTGSRGPFVLLTIDLFVNRKPYRYPEDLPTSPRSEANNSVLPKPMVPSWDPHCPRFGPQSIVPDAQPNSLAPLGSQVTAPPRNKQGSRSTDRTAPSADGGLSGLLVQPMEPRPIQPRAKAARR